MQYFFLVVFVSVSSVFGAPGLPGGFTPQNSTEYQDTAWKAVSQINSDNNGQFYYVPIKVISAQTQVVAGSNTELEVLVGESSCAKTVQLAQVNSSKCQYKNGGSRALYKVSIWEKPWENFEQITATKIRNVDSKEQF